MMEKISATAVSGRPRKQQHQPKVIEIIASTSAAIARGCVRCDEEAYGDADDIGAAANIRENSGNEPSGFHSVAPTASTMVDALTRFSEINCLTWSAEIGPYSRPSAPMILYMQHSGLKIRRTSTSEVSGARYHVSGEPRFARRGFYLTRDTF